MLHDEQCIAGGVAFQLKQHFQQTFPLLSPELYKHQKTTKLNPNPPWMKKNYKKTLNIDYCCFLPSMNHYRFMEIEYICQLFYSTCFIRLSIPIFNIPCHLQLLCIYKTGGSNHLLYIFILLHSWCCILSTFPTLQTLKPNTCKSC